eukprot:CAMPEP_0172673550 /NCGR_PEP_ID=MMETSP1074-20121228/12214_1 /TAXON_ID=2916 /ORGANISM="Ceratium fusus, Strain PA161109" /LENGTH=365 /DNA_ID=CAMNT_0013490863 /DNA_START=33 /DNA_END=1130 /DNA_ORIENTATION=+
MGAPRSFEDSFGLATTKEAVKEDSSNNISWSSGSGSNNIGVPVWRSLSCVAAFSSIVLFLVAVHVCGHALPGLPGSPGIVASSARLAAARRQLHADFCGKLRVIKIEKILVNNLGGKGPDKDAPPYMLFEVTMSDQTKAHLKVDNFTDYLPHETKDNGLYGEWISIILQEGQEVGLVATFHDPEKDENLTENLTIPQGYMTFGDIDAGANGEKEFLMVAKFFEHYYIGDHTMLQVEDHFFATTFWGTHREFGHDNPRHHGHDVMGVQQKKKAVTMSLAPDVKAATFRFGCLKGRSPREIRFNFHAAMLCSQTRMLSGKILDAMETGQGNVFPRVDGKEAADSASLNMCNGTDCPPEEEVILQLVD